MICTFIKPDQEQCQANAMTDSVYCFSHNPEMREEKKMAVTKGGLSPKKNYTPLPPIELTDSKSVVNLLVATIGQVRAGTVELRVANCIGFLASHLIKALELSDLENRVKEIERLTLERITYK
ncbi:MAG: hypothetical protein AAB410_00420 [Patescibacteria group bacterium]